MLDFLILGIIPGTSITLTITWVLVISLFIALGALAYVELKKVKDIKDHQTRLLGLASKIVRHS